MTFHIDNKYFSPIDFQVESKNHNTVNYRNKYLAGTVSRVALRRWTLAAKVPIYCPTPLFRVPSSSPDVTYTLIFTLEKNVHTMYARITVHVYNNGTVTPATAT